MKAAMHRSRKGETEGRKAVFPLRSAVGWLLIVLLYVAGVSHTKNAMIEQLAQRSLQTLKVRHPKVLSLFQASFYFFREEQFFPGVRQNLEPAPDSPKIDRIVILDNSGSEPGTMLFDSSNPAGKSGLFPEKPVIEALSGKGPKVFASGFNLRVLVPAGPYGILYVFDASAVRNVIVLLLFGGLGALFGLQWLWKRRAFFDGYHALRRFWTRNWRLRARFLFTIAAIIAITISIMFVKLSHEQTIQQTQRLRQESVLFSKFSTSQVIAAFTNYFYFYYNEQFLPVIKGIIASNENLLGMRIISCRTHRVLFDSEQAFLATPKLTDAPAFEMTPETEEQLKNSQRGQEPVIRETRRNGEPLIAVVTTHFDENNEALFWVEYAFNFQSLKKSVQEIRRQILTGLIPSTAIGLLIAVVFAQLLISPIRKLMSAVQRVTTGDYDVTVDLKSNDEIGELVTAFNGMTAELRKKRELRKYLSDSTYRQIMAAPESSDGIKLGGQRVAATVLFSDIRNFVAHCESLDAEEVTTMLNEYFSEMVEVVYKHGGEVDKFIGDALLAVFYASEEGSTTIRPLEAGRRGLTAPNGVSTALQAIYCGLEMRDRLVEFNKRRKSLNKKVIEIGVGITHGEIISGPIGSKDRMDFTVIGDVVNLANRIEKLSKQGTHTKIVFSNHIEEKVRDLLDYEELLAEKIRGKEEDVRVYELIGVRDLDVLVKNVAEGDANLRRRSVELLGQSRNPKALPHVIKTLKDSDESMRLHAVLAISKLALRDDQQALDALFECLRTETSEKVISSLIAAIGKLCATERILVISRFLNSENERIVANTVEALGQVRSAQCTDLILPKITSRNNRVKANTAMALFAAGHLEVIDTLKPMLMHSDPLMRSSAAFAIGELTLIAGQHRLLEQWKTDPLTVKLFLAELQECVPMLVHLLRDTDTMVKRQAILALGKIKDKSAVLPIIEMMDPNTISKELARDVTEALRSIGSHNLVREVISRLSS